MATEEEKKRISKASLKSALSIFYYIRPFKAYFYGALALLVLGSVMMLMIMGIPGEMVNAATGAETRFPFSLNTWGWIMMGLLAARAALSFLQTILFANVSERGMANVRGELYNRLITQPMDYFEGFRVGELSSRITADVEQLLDRRDPLPAKLFVEVGLDQRRAETVRQRIGDHPGQPLEGGRARQLGKGPGCCVRGGQVDRRDLQPPAGEGGVVLEDPAPVPIALDHAADRLAP